MTDVSRLRLASRPAAVLESLEGPDWSASDLWPDVRPATARTKFYRLRRGQFSLDSIDDLAAVLEIDAGILFGLPPSTSRSAIPLSDRPRPALDRIRGDRTLTSLAEAVWPPKDGKVSKGQGRLMRMSRGNFSLQTLERLAKHLGLDASAFFAV